MNALRRWKWPVLAVLLCVTVAGVAAWLGYRSYKPMRIVGPSMAETLLGKHGELQCERCSHSFKFDLEDTPLPDRLVCPNCGHVHTGGAAVKVLPGDLVRITREELSRYSVVAFEIPGEKDKLGVKRIIGLPGETVAIRDGDVYIDGTRLPSDGKARWFGPIVHICGTANTGRWQTTSPKRHWYFNTGKPLPDRARGPIPGWYLSKKPRDADASVKWVEYVHASTHDAPQRDAAAGILDNDAYNASLARQLNEVCDIRLEITVSIEEFFAFRIHDGWREWVIELDAINHTITLLLDGERQSTAALPEDPRIVGDEIPFDLSIQDGWLRLSARGSPNLIAHPINNGSGARRSSPRPVAFGAKSWAHVSVPILVSRDLYYLDPVGLPQPWTMQRPLGPEEYFVLGDNVPVSTDSRHFGPVRRDAIRGVVQLLERKQ